MTFSRLTHFRPVEICDFSGVDIDRAIAGDKHHRASQLPLSSIHKPSQSSAPQYRHGSSTRPALQNAPKMNATAKPMKHQPTT
jgi:hypothetical protein